MSKTVEFGKKRQGILGVDIFLIFDKFLNLSDLLQLEV
jgi:hypothetical protein